MLIKIVKYALQSIIFLIAVLSLMTNVMAANDDLESRFGSVKPKQNITVAGGFTSIAQTTSDSRIYDEWLTSFDIVSVIKKGENEFYFYIEGNTSPRFQGVSSQLGEANTDAGSAVDRDGKGRVQVSELHYSFPFKHGRLSAGLINPAGNLDASDVANNETTQFLSAALVNNPTIEFPDYTLGAAFNYEFDSGAGLVFLVSNSHGLADNPNKSYSELLDLNAAGKGEFYITEFHFHGWGMDIRSGYWLNTKQHSLLNGAGNKSSNSGIYASIDSKMFAGQWNLRVGMADRDVSQAAGFIGIACQYSLERYYLGAGITQTKISSQGKTALQDDTKQAEVYLRYEYNSQLQLSVSVQKLNNSGFESSGSNFDSAQTIYSLRAGYTF